MAYRGHMGEFWDCDLHVRRTGLLGKTFVENIEKLYKNCELFDYTIRVEGLEYHVHKFVMAVFSDFFRVMLTSQFKQSQETSIDLIGVTQMGFEPILDFMYKDQLLDVNKENVIDILSCSSQLQIGFISELCIDHLSSWIDAENCIPTLNLTLFYNLKSERVNLIEQALDTLFEYFYTIVETPDFLELSVDSLKLVLASPRLEESEIYRIHLIQKWMESDTSRFKHVPELIKEIRFGLVNPDTLGKLQEKFPFLRDVPECKNALDAAFAWQKLPLRERVLSGSEKTEVRTRPTVVGLGGEFYSEQPQKEPNDSMYFLTTNIDDEEVWQKADGFRRPRSSILRACAAAVVNNHLILCGGYKNQKSHVASSTCHIFDPRTMQWGTLCSMNVARAHAAIAVHNSHIYVFGGENKGHYTDITERYSFKEDRWEMLERFERGISKAAACTFENLIYIIGGHYKAGRSIKNSKSVNVFDPTTGKWSYKPDLGVAIHGHNAVVMSDQNTVNPIKYFPSKCIYVVPRGSGHIHSYFPDNSYWMKFRLNEMPPSDASTVSHDGRLFYINGSIIGEDEEGNRGKQYHACAVYNPQAMGYLKLMFLDPYPDEIEGLVACELAINSHAKQPLDHRN